MAAICCPELRDFDSVELVSNDAEGGVGTLAVGGSNVTPLPPALPSVGKSTGDPGVVPDPLACWGTGVGDAAGASEDGA